MNSLIKISRKKLFACLVIFILGLLGSCSSNNEKEEFGLLSKDEARSLAENHQRTINDCGPIKQQDWRFDFLDDKWVYSSNKPAIALFGGSHIILDARTGEVLQPISEKEVRNIAQVAIKKHYPDVVFSSINWKTMLYRGKWIIGPKIEGLGGGVTVDMDAITGEVLKVYFTE